MTVETVSGSVGRDPHDRRSDALLQAGVTQEQIDQMMVENPKRFFGGD
jgi:predicted metal-dependent phosphotriesterase family hydrolase